MSRLTDFYIFSYLKRILLEGKEMKNEHEPNSRHLHVLKSTVPRFSQSKVRLFWNWKR